MSDRSRIADRKLQRWTISKLWAQFICNPIIAASCCGLVVSGLLAVGTTTLGISCFISRAYAEEAQGVGDTSHGNPKERDDKGKFPQQGTLASVGSSGRMSKTGGFGKTVVGEEAAAPLAATVSRGKPGWWTVIVANRSEKRISADLCFVQVNDKGGDIRRDCFSEGLAGGESNQRDFRAATKVMSARVDVTKWSEKGAKSKSKQGAEAQEAGGGLAGTLNSNVDGAMGGTTAETEGAPKI